MKFIYNVVNIKASAAFNIFFSVIVLLGISGKSWGQIYYPMSGGNFTEAFTDISSWTNNYANASLGSQYWGVATSATNSPGTNFIVFTSNFTGGVQTGTANMVLLATGTNFGATDLYIDFTGRIVGNFSFDWAKIVNTTSNKLGALKIQYSTTGKTGTFTDLTGTGLPIGFDNSNTTQSGSISSISIPTILNNSQVIFRFYFGTSDIGGTGNRPKVSIDNINITSTAPSGFTIAVGQVTGGTVSPSSGVGVTGITSGGNSATFTATPTSCYNFTSWVVDGTNIGATGTYQFINVTQDHTLTAAYTIKTYGINSSAGANGSISPAGTTSINCGSNQVYTITPNSGYGVQDVLVDGASVGAVTTYTFSNVTTTHTISVTFVLVTTATDYFKSNVTTGNWGTPGSWISSHDNSTFFTATAAPTSAATAINILNPHTITLTGTTTAKNLTIELGATLIHSSSVNFTITDDPLVTKDFDIFGTYIMDGNKPTTSGSVYVEDGGTVKVISNTNNTDIFPSLSNVYFLNNSIFDWATTQSPGIQYSFFPNVLGSRPIFRFSSPVTNMGGGGATIINGILDAKANISFTGTGSKTFRDGITGTSTITIPAGVGAININGTSPILGGLSLIINIDNPINIPSGITIPSGAVVKVQPITTGYTPNFANKGFNNFLVDKVGVLDGIIDMTTCTISNTGGAVIVKGTLKTGSPDGLYVSGSNATVPTASSIVTLNSGSTIEYNGTNQNVQGTAGGLSAYDNVIFSGSGTKIISPNNPSTVNGTITISGSTTFNALDNSFGGAGTKLIMTGTSKYITAGTGTKPDAQGAYALGSGTTVEFSNTAATEEDIRLTPSYSKIVVSGSSVANSSLASTPLNIQTGGSFIVTNTGTFKHMNINGFSGAANTAISTTNNPTINIQDGSTIEYYRNNGTAQTISTSVNIGQGTTGNYYSLKLSGSGNKTAPSGTLEIKGNIIDSATANFIHSNGVVLLNGTFGQSFKNTSSNAFAFYNLTNNSTLSGGGFTVNSSGFNVEKELKLNTLSAIKLNTGDIVLKSIATNTTNVAAVPNEINIIQYPGIGRFVVERFMNVGVTHGQTWQFVSAPASGETVKATWQDGAPIIPRPGIGVWMTKPTAAAGVGYDANTFGYSLKSFNSVSNVFDGKTNTTDLLDEPRGYMLFTRGDRTVTGPSIPATLITLRSRGKIYSPGNLPVYSPAPVVPVGTYLSVGNPYPSAISLAGFNTAAIGLETNYWVWDPSLYGNYGVGGYQTISGTAGNIMTPGSTNIYNSGGPYPNIQSGQAFFVKTNAASYNIGFNETMKVSANILVNRTNGPADRAPSEIPMFSTLLYTTSGNIADGNRVVFDAAYLNIVDDMDAGKFNNAGENFGLIRNNKFLAVEAHNILSVTDTLFYNMSNLREGLYNLVFATQNLTLTNVTGELIDSYLNTRTPVSLSDSTFITIPVTSAGASKAADRFMVVFKPATVLPVTFTSITAQRQDKKILVTWQVTNEQNIDHYEVERSADGRNFTAVSTQAATNNTGAGNTTYNWLDINPNSGVNFYRIRSTGRSNETKYSDAVKVNAASSLPSFSVFPNPIGNNGKISLSLTDQPAGLYQIQLINAAGQIILQRSFNHAGGSAAYPVSINEAMATGNYLLKVVNENGYSETVNLIK